MANFNHCLCQISKLHFFVKYLYLYFSFHNQTITISKQSYSDRIQIDYTQTKASMIIKRNRKPKELSETKFESKYKESSLICLTF